MGFKINSQMLQKITSKAEQAAVKTIDKAAPSVEKTINETDRKLYSDAISSYHKAGLNINKRVGQYMPKANADSATVDNLEKIVTKDVPAAEIKAAKEQSHLSSWMTLSNGKKYKLTNSLNGLNGNKFQVDPLFIKNIEMRQGKIGDCYLISALDALSHNKEGRKALSKLINKQEDGSYKVVFGAHKNFPITVHPSELNLDIQARTKQQMNIIEIAYGKLRQHLFKKPDQQPLELLNSGESDRTIYDITGWNRGLKYTTRKESKVVTGDSLSNEMSKLEQNYNNAHKQLIDLNSEYKDHCQQYKEVEETLKNFKEEFKDVPEVLSKPLLSGQEQTKLSIKSSIEQIIKKANEIKKQKMEMAKEYKSIKAVTNDLNNIGKNPGKYVVCAGTPSKDFAKFGIRSDAPADRMFMDQERRFATQHAYSIRNVDPEKKTVTLINPWNNSKEINISYDDFYKYFAKIMAVKTE